MEKSSHRRSVLFAFKAETGSQKLSGLLQHVNGVALLAVFGCMQGGLCHRAGLAARICFHCWVIIKDEPHSTLERKNCFVFTSHFHTALSLLP